MKILIFDTETSGLPQDRNATLISTHKWPYILQLSYILYNTTEKCVLEYFDTIINIEDYVVIDPNSINIHKITKEKCKNEGRNIKSVLNIFNNVLKNTDLLVGHNLQFDKNVLLVEFLRNKIVNNFNINNKPIPSFCTMTHGKSICNLTFKTRDGRILPKNPKLIELYKHLFNCEPLGLHNSMSDVIVCFRCYYHMQFNLDIFKESVEIKNLADNYLI